MRRLVVDLNDQRPIWAAPERVIESLRSALPSDWELRVVRSPADGRGDGGAASAEAAEVVRGAEVYFGYGLPRPLWEPATAPPLGNLRWVHSAAAGVRGSLYPEMRGSDVLLTNSAGIHGEPIAETVLATILYFARGLDFAAEAQRRRTWDKAPFERADTAVKEVAGATVGILGLGGIGRQVARRALALGTRVLAWKRSPAEVEGIELHLGEEGLRRVLRESDYLVIALPETAETQGLLGQAELDLLDDRAVLVNVARGGIVEEAALLERLHGGLRGAALDVFETEPLPPESPLWSAPRLLILPHVSGTTDRFWDRQLELMLDNLRRYLSGRPLRNLVDKELGY